MFALLKSADKLLNDLAPCVVDPYNSANASEFFPIKSTKSAIGIPALAETSLNSTRFCPNVAPTDDNVLNWLVTLPKNPPALARVSPTTPNSASDFV